MRDQYRVNAVRGEEDIVVNVTKTLNSAVAFARKDERARKLRGDGYALHVFRDHPSLVFEVPPTVGA